MIKFKIIVLIAICALFGLTFITAGTALTQPSVVLDGKILNFDVPPVVENGRTLVPARRILENLGATVDWDEATQTVIATKGSTVIKMTIGSTVSYIGDKPVALDMPAKIVNGRTLVPLRFVSEGLGAIVQYDDATATISISSLTRGKFDPDFVVEKYDSNAVWPGKTLLIDNHKISRPRIIEVNMLGEIVWEYVLPDNLKKYTNPGFDAELLPNNNILMELPGNGIYEINRKGDILWSYIDSKVSHDADLLPNGNILVAFGANDGKDDSQVKEVSRDGKVVWSWEAKKYFDKPPYNEINSEGWTHTNAVTRLSNGNTLISMRNFDIVVEVNHQGEMVRIIGGNDIFNNQHDPEILPDGNVLVASHTKPNRVIEINPQTGETVWQYIMPDGTADPVRDANRLPNGNTLITGSCRIIEVTPDGKIVWQFKMKTVPFKSKADASSLGFYKADRIR